MLMRKISPDFVTVGCHHMRTASQLSSLYLPRFTMRINQLLQSKNNTQTINLPTEPGLNEVLTRERRYQVPRTEHHGKKHSSVKWAVNLHFMNDSRS